MAKEIGLEVYFGDARWTQSNKNTNLISTSKADDSFKCVN